MNKVLDDGEYAIGALYGHTRPIRDGDIVIVKRHRAGLVETTLKRYRIEDGMQVLRPESTDPRFQEPVALESAEEDVSVEIFALVIGGYRSLA